MAKPVKLQTLWERENGTCWICLQAVPMPGEVAETDPESATRDHLVQRRRGGSDGYRNLRLAHRRCNEGRERVVTAPAQIHLALERAWRTHLQGRGVDEPVDLDALLDVTFDELSIPRASQDPPRALGTHEAASHLGPTEVGRAVASVAAMPDRVLVAELQDRLGEPLVVFVARWRVRNVRQVRWQHAPMPGDVAIRLRLAMTGVLMLSERGVSDASIRLWLATQEPRLRRTPLETLREIDTHDDPHGPAFLDAALNANPS